MKRKAVWQYPYREKPAERLLQRGQCRDRPRGKSEKDDEGRTCDKKERLENRTSEEFENGGGHGGFNERAEKVTERAQCFGCSARD